MNQEAIQRRTWSNRTPLRIGMFALLFFVLVIGVWGVQANISGAVLSSGRVQVSPIRTALQHPDGGIVAELLIESGATVAAGDVVLRLDSVQLNAELSAIESELFETLANSARLNAVINDATELTLDPLLAEKSVSDETVQSLLKRQQQQLLAYYALTETTERSLQDQIEQVELQIVGSESELDSKVEELEFIKGEYIRMNDAFQQGIATLSEAQAVRKEQIRIEGEIGKLTAGIAALKGKVLEVELTLHSLIPNQKEEAVDKLNTSQRESSRFLENRKAILGDLGKLEIRSPISGTIHDLKIQGLRSVVVAATPLMYVVPDDNPVTITARVNASDIDQVMIGQSARMKFNSLNARALPTIYGEVSKVSADAFLDNITQKYYFDIEIFLTDAEIEKLGSNELVSGMPVSVYLTTSSRSPVEYITRPLTLYLDRALKDN